MAGEKTDVTLPAGCLSSAECLGYLDGSEQGPPAQTVQQHLDECERCRVLVAETARGVFADGASGPAAVRALADGDKLGGRYEIRRFIARGGMGEVYEAFDLALGDTVALKTLSPTTLDQSDASGRLIAEVRLARRVMHPNVCRILEFGLHRRQGESVEVIPFITMELLDGETLGSRVRRDGPLDPDAALRVLKELAAGLRAVHEAGVVHRDFKTENVFMVRGKGDAQPERAVVMDFGLARALEMNRSAGGSSVRGLIGTVAYMAPEQVEGQRPTPAVDVYALGIVAFEMLTGRLPFVGDSPIAVATARLRQAAPRPSSIRPALAPAWDVFIGRCLSRDPTARLGGMPEVLDGLDRIASGSSSGSSSLPSRRHLSRAAGALGLALAIAAVIGVSRSAPRRSAPPIARPVPATGRSAGDPPIVDRPIGKRDVAAPAAPQTTAQASPAAIPVGQAGRPVRKRRILGPTAGPARDLAEAGAIPPEVDQGEVHEGEDDLVNPFAPEAPK